MGLYIYVTGYFISGDYMNEIYVIYLILTAIIFQNIAISFQIDKLSTRYHSKKYERCMSIVYYSMIMIAIFIFSSILFYFYTKL